MVDTDPTTMGIMVIPISSGEDGEDTTGHIGTNKKECMVNMTHPSAGFLFVGERPLLAQSRHSDN